MALSGTGGRRLIPRYALSMTEKYLHKVYSVDSPEANRKLYADWSASYDAEVTENGYATPRRVAEALAQFADRTAPALDLGCGTGLSGVALRAAGFDTIDGIDITPEMIAQAEAKGAYRSLTAMAPGLPIPGGYATIAAIGVIGAGAAPADTFDHVMRALPNGGHFGLSFNDHALADRTFEGKVSEWVDCSAARLLFREYGDHLPGIDLRSMVYVLQKA